jgi:hypothetical protein
MLKSVITKGGPALGSRESHAGGAANPWVSPSERADAAATAELSEAQPVDLPAPPAPQPGVFPPPPEQRLRFRELSRAELLVPLWLVSAHGGAGSSTLAVLSVTWRSAGQAWPVSQQAERPARVLLCARVSYAGLRAAQAALTDWASGRVPVALEGLVLLAAAPGRFPKQLRPLAELVRGAVSGRVWVIGWHSEWLVGPATLPQDRGIRDLFMHFNVQPKEA